MTKKDKKQREMFALQLLLKETKAIIATLLQS